MSCDCGQVSIKSQTERHVVRVALFLNALMCVIGLGAAYFAQSTGILADAIDMGADASGYALALTAIGRSIHFRVFAARWIGGVLMLLGMCIVAEAARRWVIGSEPLGPVMVIYSVISFGINLYVLRTLSKIREGGVHLNASYICTRLDVMANIVVFISGGVVWLTGIHWVDLLAGIVISVLVFIEAKEILEEAETKETKEQALL